jgi:hypothetical protein
MIIIPPMFIYGALDKSDVEIEFLPPEQMALDAPYKWPMLNPDESIGLNKDSEKQHIG